MISTLLEWARNNPIIRKVNLGVQSDNAKAIVLYKKFGFEIEGTIRRHTYISGTFYDSYAMGLLVD